MHYVQCTCDVLPRTFVVIGRFRTTTSLVFSFCSHSVLDHKDGARHATTRSPPAPPSVAVGGLDVSREALFASLLRSITYITYSAMPVRVPALVSVLR